MPAVGDWLAALAIVLAVLATRGVWFGDAAADFDEQLYSFIGWRMTHGDLPYVEVWDRKAFFDKTMFLLNTTNGDREFPLRPDTTTFAYLANGRRTSNPAANSIRIDAKRVGDSK